MAAAESAYVAKESFATFKDGMPRVINKGDMVASDDPLVAKGSPNRDLFEPVSDFIRTQTAPPPVLRAEDPVPEPEEAPRRRGRRNQPKENNDMPHTLPPEDPDSPASPFAPYQPAAGVAADDVDDGGTKAADWTPPADEPEPKDEKPAKASGDTAKK